MPFERVRLSCVPAPPAACPQGPDATLQVHIALHAAYVYLTRPTAAKPQTELDQAPLFTPDHPAAVELERPQSTQDTPARTTSGLGFPGKVEARAVVPGVRPRLPRQGRSSCRRPRTLSGARVSAFGSTSSSAPLLCPLPIRRPSTVSRQEKGSLGRLPGARPHPTPTERGPAGRSVFRTPPRGVSDLARGGPGPRSNRTH